MQWALSGYRNESPRSETKAHYLAVFGYLLLWEDGIACSRWNPLRQWLDTLCNYKFHVHGILYFNFFMHSRASIPSHLHRCLRDLILRAFLVPYLLRKRGKNCQLCFIIFFCAIVAHSLRNRSSQVWKSAVVWQAVTTKSLSTCKYPNKLATSR